MLLFIALANSHYFLQGSSVLGGFPQDGSTIDSITVWFIATFVDGRAFPMFGLLFGYGVAMIVRRRRQAARPAVRRLLWRRASVLVVVGALHGLLLYSGDILAAYGVLLLVGAWAVFWPDRRVLVTATFFFVLGSLPSLDSASTSSAPPDPSMLPPDLLTQIGERAAVTPFIAVLGPIGFACPFLVGLWAGRRRVLEDVAEHRRLLRSTATIGIGAAVLGAQPVAWMLSGLTSAPGDDVLQIIGPLHDASGVLGGFGCAALIALVAARIGAGRPTLVLALAATGQRSMTCYLAQSLVWAALFTPYLLDLSATLSVTATAAIAATTWAATVLLAEVMRRAGRRGPFETLVRRVTYGQGFRDRGPA